MPIWWVNIIFDEINQHSVDEIKQKKGYEKNQ